jgi:hypothetical protein
MGWMNYITAIIAAICLAFGMGTGWEINGWRLNGKIATLQSAHSDEISRQATGALKDLKEATGIINDAAKNAKTDNLNLNNQLAGIRRDIKNAPKLPIDCKPDDIRMRSLAASIDATNKAITGSVADK